MLCSPIAKEVLYFKHTQWSPQGEAAPLFLMILGFFLNAFEATGLESLLIPGFGEIGRAEEEISTRRWYAYQGRFFRGLRKKSPARGCLLTGLEEVGMKERRETSFRSTILKAILVPDLN